MRRKDMQPGVLYAIAHCGNYRPGLIHDASNERIRARVYWTWPGTLWPYDEPVDPTRMEVDYLNPNPDILNPIAKFDEKVVKTGDVLMEWTEYAEGAKRDRAERLQARLDQEAAEAAQRAAEIAERLAQVEALAPVLQGAPGYLTITDLIYRAKGEWTRDYYSARDVVTLLEHVVRQGVTL